MSKIALVIIADDNVINKKYCHAVIKSFFEYNKWFTGDIVFFEDGVINKISEKNKIVLQSLYNKVIIKHINYDKYNDLFNQCVDKFVSPRFIHSYPKFEIFNLIEYDKILCIDSDIIFNDSIEELFNRNISLGVTSSMRYFMEDISLDYCYTSLKIIGNTTCDSGGFNGGVIYLGNKYFINKNIYNEIYQYINEYINSNNCIAFFEQDILNHFFSDKYSNNVTWLSPYYNVEIFDYKRFNMFTNYGKPLNNVVDFYSDKFDKVNMLLNKGKIIHYLQKYESLQDNTRVKKLYEQYIL